MISLLLLFLNEISISTDDCDGCVVLILRYRLLKAGKMIYFVDFFLTKYIEVEWFLRSDFVINRFHLLLSLDLVKIPKYSRNEKSVIIEANEYESDGEERRVHAANVTK